MDKIVIIAGVIAIIAVLGVTLILSPFEDKPTPKPAEDDTPEPIEPEPIELDEPDEPDEPDVPIEKPDPISIDQTDVEEIIKPEVEGDCELYLNFKTDRYECFGTAGNFSTTPLSGEYREAEHDKYFCKPTRYGCRLYERVDVYFY